RILEEKAFILGKQQYYGKAIDTLQTAHKLAKECNYSFSEAYVLKRLSTLYETVELFGEAYRCIGSSLKIFRLMNLKHTQKVEKKCKRLRKEISQLEHELEKTEEEIKKLTKLDFKLKQNHQNNKTKPLRAKLRTLRRQSKRLKQKLGIEPGLVRLGKR
ncbi:MAG: hypothetical protein AAF629_04385, partial [Chloroflexota bacterium]